MTANSKTNLSLATNSCRICLNHYFNYNVEIKGNKQQLFEDCIGDTMINGSTLLCPDCIKKLEDFDQFKKMAQNSNKLWNSGVYVFENVQIKVENETDAEKHTTDDFFDKKHCYDILCVKNDTLDDSTEVKHADNLRTVFKSNKKYQSNKTLCKKKKHLDKIKTESTYQCGLCSYKSLGDNLEMINTHVAEHYSNNDLNCQLCEFRGFDFADMETHRFFHQSHIKTVWCHICSKKTISKTALTFHFRIKHISNNNVCACRYCNRTYRTYKKWKLHERLHTDTNKFQCDICAREFINKSGIKTHIMETHLKIGCICYICGKKVGRRQYLERHVRMVHDPNQQSIKCSHCNRTFKSHAHLEVHKARINKSMIYTCPHCPKLFHDKNYRNKHVIFHTGVRPFQCTLCKASYKVKSMLKIHMRKHTGERPFVCSTCGKGFVTSQQLKRHMGMHSGNRGKQCLYCDRSFYYRNLLNAHMHKAHSQVMQTKE